MNATAQAATQESNMTTATVIREFFGIRYGHAEFGARPDQTHPHMVSHPLSAGRYVVVECESMADAYITAHAVMGTKIQDGPLKGRSMAGGGVEVFRAAEHEPVTVGSGLGDELDAILGGALSRVVTMTITASDMIPAIPHFASGPLSRYSPVNGWEVPRTIDL